MITANVLSFLIAAAALAAIRLDEPRPARTETHWRQQFAGGLRFLWRDAPLRRTTVAVAIAALSFGTLEAVMFAYVDRGLHRPPTFLGVLVTLQGIAGPAGGPVAARHQPDRRGGDRGTRRRRLRRRLSGAHLPRTG